MGLNTSVAQCISALHEPRRQHELPSACTDAIGIVAADRVVTSDEIRTLKLIQETIPNQPLTVLRNLRFTLTMLYRNNIMQALTDESISVEKLKVFRKALDPDKKEPMDSKERLKAIGELTTIINDNTDTTLIAHADMYIYVKAPAEKGKDSHESQLESSMIANMITHIIRVRQFRPCTVRP